MEADDASRGCEELTSDKDSDDRDRVGVGERDGTRDGVSLQQNIVKLSSSQDWFTLQRDQAPWLGFFDFKTHIPFIVPLSLASASASLFFNPAWFLALTKSIDRGICADCSLILGSTEVIEIGDGSGLRDPTLPRVFFDFIPRPSEASTRLKEDEVSHGSESLTLLLLEEVDDSQTWSRLSISLYRDFFGLTPRPLVSLTLSRRLIILSK